MASTGSSRSEAARAALANPEFRDSYQQLIRRLLFLLGAFVVFRFGAHVPVPGINPIRLAELYGQNKDTILGLFNTFSGGALERMSIFALSIIPYISASIIVQLLTAAVPSFEALKKEGESGRRKISQYTRQLTLVLALIQATGMCAGMVSQGLTLSSDLFNFYVPAVSSLVAGTMFLMWLGEQITERGIGNGTSMIIFAGIVAGMPALIGQSFEALRLGQISAITLVVMAVLSLVVVAAVVFIEKAQRRIPLNYAQKQQGRMIPGAQKSHLPMKINMAGVIPAIFASSLLLFPASIGQWMGNVPNPNIIQRGLMDVSLLLSPGQPFYLVLFALLIVFFCYFYTAIMFSPKEVAEHLKRSNAFVPGLRPGDQTARYIDVVLNRLTFIGAIYIAAVCLLPMILTSIFSIQFALGGTSLLIVVVVVMDFVSQVQSYLTSHQYKNQVLMRRPNSTR